MNQMFQTMRCRYNTFIQKFFTDKQRLELKLDLEQTTQPTPVQIEETKDDGLTFTQRVQNGTMKTDLSDLKALAFHLMLELNALAGRTLLLQHKLIEVFRAAPRFVSEYL
jgi:hypothetical protein